VRCFEFLSKLLAHCWTDVLGNLKGARCHLLKKSDQSTIPREVSSREEREKGSADLKKGFAASTVLSEDKDC